MNDQRAFNTDADEVLHATLRGVIGAMAMTGMRSFMHGAGLVKEPPPRAIVRQKSKGVFRVLPTKKRRAVVEVFHWVVGAQAGAIFGLLPDRVRRTRGAGPVYGLLVWLGYESAIAPALGLSQAKKPRPVERLALAADHLLYGFVLSEMRGRPQD